MKLYITQIYREIVFPTIKPNQRPYLS